MKVARLIALSSGQAALDTKMYVALQRNHIIFSLESRQTVVDHNIRTNLEKWLQPATVALSQRDAENKRHKGTGSWLLERGEFIEWFYATNSLLWLYGICQYHCARLPDVYLICAFQRAAAKLS